MNTPESLNKNRRLADVADQVLELGGMAAWFAGVERATLHDDGRRENDAEHSFMLSFVAPYLARSLYPDHDIGLVSMYSTVHDMVEMLTGDIPTFAITENDKKIKQENEIIAAGLLINKLPQPWSDLLERYELQQEPEARLTRVVDKIMPAIMHVHGDGKKCFNHNYGIVSRKEFYEKADDNTNKLKNEYPEYSDIIEIRSKIIIEAVQKMFPD